MGSEDKWQCEYDNSIERSGALFFEQPRDVSQNMAPQEAASLDSPGGGEDCIHHPWPLALFQVNRIRE